jgi:hypothetical protein
MLEEGLQSIVCVSKRVLCVVIARTDLLEILRFFGKKHSFETNRDTCTRVQVHVYHVRDFVCTR